MSSLSLISLSLCAASGVAAAPRPATSTLSALADQTLPLLESVVSKPFFRYFRVSLCSQCVHEGFPAPMCGSPECAVCECSRSDLPCDKSGKCFLLPEVDTAFADEKGGPECDDEDVRFSRLDMQIDAPAFGTWSEGTNPWTLEENESLDQLAYVDLIRNPERWTGYTSRQYSNRIWEAIYNENCFEQTPNCQGDPQTLLYRLISGLHTSITTHIVATSCLERVPLGPCVQWGTDLPAFSERVFAHQDRERNLHFIYTLLLRAYRKAESYFLNYDYDVIDNGEALPPSLLDSFGSYSAAVAGFLRTSKEGRAAQGMSGASDAWSVSDQVERLLKSDLRIAATRAIFQNITSILDCVGCDKCKLWGKLQFQGIGVALRILDAAEMDSSSADADDDLRNADRTTLSSSNGPLRLRRTDVIAFVNTLARITHSVSQVEKLSRKLRPAAIPRTALEWAADVIGSIPASFSHGARTVLPRLDSTRLKTCLVQWARSSADGVSKFAFFVEKSLYAAVSSTADVYVPPKSTPDGTDGSDGSGAVGDASQCSPVDRVRAATGTYFAVVVAAFIVIAIR